MKVTQSRRGTNSFGSRAAFVAQDDAALTGTPWAGAVALLGMRGFAAGIAAGIVAFLVARLVGVLRPRVDGVIQEGQVQRSISARGDRRAGRGG